MNTIIHTLTPVFLYGAAFILALWAILSLAGVA
jgi:hypothetical protein